MWSRSAARRARAGAARSRLQLALRRAHGVEAPLARRGGGGSRPARDRARSPARRTRAASARRAARPRRDRRARRASARRRVEPPRARAAPRASVRAARPVGLQEGRRRRASAYPRTPVSSLSSAVDSRCAAALRRVDPVDEQPAPFVEALQREQADDEPDRGDEQQPADDEGEPRVTVSARRRRVTLMRAARATSSERDVVDERAAVERPPPARRRGARSSSGAVAGTARGADQLGEALLAQAHGAVADPALDHAVRVQQQRPAAGSSTLARRPRRVLQDAERRPGRAGASAAAGACPSSSSGGGWPASRTVAPRAVRAPA